MKLKSNSKDVENDIEDDCQDEARCLKTSASDDLVIVVWPPPLTLISLQLQSGPDHQHCLSFYLRTESIIMELVFY